MKIKVRKDAVEGSQVISLSDSKRYLSIMPNFGFRTMSYWKTRGLPSDNIFGEGKSGDGHSALCIPANINFSNSSTKVTVSTRVWASNPSNHTFCWAITKYPYDSLFKGHGAATSKYNAVLNQGTFTVDVGGVHIQTFTFPVNGLTGGRFYIYWWSNNNNYGNVHVSGSFTVTVYTASGDYQYYNATPYIWKDGVGWKQARPYIYKKDSRSWSSG